jgi:lipopolysaccharide/colanic/teichoic acid biosynthesis glycosyltransferase
MITRTNDFYTVSDTIHMESKAGQAGNSHLFPGGHLFFHEIARKELKSWRVIDFFFGTFLVLFALPFAPVIWVLVRLTSKGPGFQRLRFTGYRGKIFTGFLFRTTEFQPSGSFTFIEGSQSPDTKLTSVGKFLRKFNLHRMPLLLNLISGELSLAGSTLYSDITASRLNSKIPWFYKSFAIKPGIFSLAEINDYKSGQPDTQMGVIQSGYDISFALNRKTATYLKIFFFGLLGINDTMPVPVNAEILKDFDINSESIIPENSSEVVALLGS